jgi:tRNA nucleotidyltransferase (CCA-adding enzyme)
MSCEPLARFCGFFHDIGKLATSPALYPRHFDHEQTGFVMSGEFCQRMRLPAQYGKSLAWVSRLHGKLYKWEELRDSTRMRTAEQAIKAGITDILPLVSAADKAGGSEPGQWRKALRIAGMSSTELGIDPQDLERLKPAKRADRILQKRVERLRAIPTASI